MRKLIAAINMSLDGFCDHTAMTADDELHQHYADLINDAGLLLYGRITYQLMESYWPSIVKEPTGNKSTDDFAIAIDKVPKIVFSRTLKKVDWKSATLKNEIRREEIVELKQSHDGGSGDVFVGSPSLIVTMAQLGLIDEYQLAIHPTIVGAGLPLFKNITARIDLRLLKTKAFGSGVVTHYYEPARK